MSVTVTDMSVTDFLAVFLGFQHSKRVRYLPHPYKRNILLKGRRSYPMYKSCGVSNGPYVTVKIWGILTLLNHYDIIDSDREKRAFL